jgi:trehalose 6-phosphate phosphatase
MRNLTGRYDPAIFFRQLRQAERKALLLDFDGTLAPFHPDPDQVVFYPGVQSCLEKLLERRSTRLVLVTGRATESIIPLLGLRYRPEIWGSHGLERLHPDDNYELIELDEAALRGLAKAREWARREAVFEKCDVKPGCLALNFRGMERSRAERVRARAAADWEQIAIGTGLSLHEYDGGIELRVPVRNKGDAVVAIRSEIGVDSPIAYLGDDLTDEDAFRALDVRGIGILVRTELRETAADWWLMPPGELIDFLQAWLDNESFAMVPGSLERR